MVNDIKYNQNIIERYNWVERYTHTFHAISMIILLFTGFAIYYRWNIISMHNARTWHMIAVPFLLVTNWILVPYGIISHGLEEGGIKGIGHHFLNSYIFNKNDYDRLKKIISNFFGKEKKYPKYSIYLRDTNHYYTKLHPLFKIFIVIEGICIFLVFITGLVLYDVDWIFLNIHVSRIIISLFGYISSLFHMNSLSFIRLLHLLMTYFFVFEFIIHVFILEFNPKVFRYWKSIFIDGKEEIDGPIIETIESKDVH